VGETIKRTSSGRDLMKQLGQAKPRLLCSLVHKFGRKDVDDFETFIKDLKAKPSPTVSEVFVFVDECHRTQSGKLNQVMKAMMPNAVFIGFTGTPLLKKDRQASLEVFGSYIHTYKFSEAVESEVVLDLIYQARDIDQWLGSQDKIDAWFDAKTKGLNDWQKDELPRWRRRVNLDQWRPPVKAQKPVLRSLPDSELAVRPESAATKASAGGSDERGHHHHERNRPEKPSIKDLTVQPHLHKDQAVGALFAAMDVSPCPISEPLFFPCSVAKSRVTVAVALSPESSPRALRSVPTPRTG
jgi:hypothetical protein